MSVFDWIIIFQRFGYSNWKLPWADYKAGFGSINADFWLGLEKIHLLTSSQPYRLRVEVQQQDTELWFSAEYWSFKIGDELNDKYRLEVSGYSGDAGDSLMYEGDYFGNGRFGYYCQHGMAFSTFDQDNDPSSNSNCAGYWRGGWWFNRCHYSCLTCKKVANEWSSLQPSANILVINSRMMIKPQWITDVFLQAWTLTLASPGCRGWDKSHRVLGQKPANGTRDVVELYRVG